MSSATAGLVFHGTGPPDEPELAYELLRRAQGQGFATEAAGAVVAWATEAGYQRLYSSVRDWNVASLRVLEKLGFLHTGQVIPDDVHGDNLLLVRAPRVTGNPHAPAPLSMD